MEAPWCHGAPALLLQPNGVTRSVGRDSRTWKGIIPLVSIVSEAEGVSGTLTA